MKIRIVVFAAATLWVGCAAAAAAQQAEPTGPERRMATIDARQIGEPISKYEYGMFIEHIGSLVYRSLWSEMLDDRKFYHPISSKEPDTGAHAPTGPFRTLLPRRWRPVGPDEFVVMDKDHPFVGEQSARIQLDPATPHGIRQSGLALVKGKQYTGRIILRGTPGARVKVTLIWGEGANDRQTVTFGPLPATYGTLPLSPRWSCDRAQRGVT